jgi:hypothetical protein
MSEHVKPGDEKDDFYAWIGMLGPAVIWLANFEIIYAGVLSACEAKSKIVLFLCCLICLALIGGCAWLCMRERSTDPDHQARAFMAKVGLMTAALFALVTIAQTIAVFIMDPCLT